MEQFNHKNPFIAQTAEDYDMDYECVEYIYNHYHENFYEKLEEFIKRRSETP
jgi:hypothetical protein